MVLPEVLEIRPRSGLAARVRVPGSKSLTNRALPIAALASGTSTLTGALESDDTRVMIESLAALGCRVESDGPTLQVSGQAGHLAAPDAPLYVGNSGTTARFLTAVASLARGPVRIDGDARMRERPIADLVRALSELGAPCDIQGENGCPPLTVAGGGLPGGHASVDARRSSQYVSALIIAAPCAQHDVELDFLDSVTVSRPYIELTLQCVRAFGATADWTPGGGLRIEGGSGYRARDYAIEPDASAAVYPLCAAALARGHVRVQGIPQDSIQADLAVLDVLEGMGCRVARGADFAEVQGAELLRGFDVDMNEFPDAAVALAVVAAFAEGESRIRNVANLRIKESDRLAALECELRKLGAEAKAGPDSLRIVPGPPRAAQIDTYDDHRMAMAFSLAGLRIPGIAIRDPACVSKTWPGYFAMLETL
ncbi:MAG: 3-phosphoshikimate 1-carboxyvinyltransferase [Myxococcales bacterium]|nr:3-phosphoshikimate 1-carboxyvinyltransferase [Myxococcales bacterium]